MATKIRCKMKVSEVKLTACGTSLLLEPVINGSEENKKFWTWTPSGKLSLDIVNTEATKDVKPAQEYYVDLTLAEDKE